MNCMIYNLYDDLYDLYDLDDLDDLVICLGPTVAWLVQVSEEEGHPGKGTWQDHGLDTPHVAQETRSVHLTYHVSIIHSVIPYTDFG